MIGHTKVAIAAPARRLGHVVESVAAIRPIRMGMENAADIGIRYQTREAIFLCQLDFAHSFAQLRLDELKPQRGVNLRLLSRDNLPTDMQAPLIEGHPLLERQFAELLDVLW